MNPREQQRSNDPSNPQRFQATNSWSTQPTYQRSTHQPFNHHSNTPQPHQHQAQQQLPHYKPAPQAYTYPYYSNQSPPPTGWQHTQNSRHSGTPQYAQPSSASGTYYKHPRSDASNCVTTSSGTNGYKGGEHTSLATPSDPYANPQVYRSHESFTRYQAPAPPNYVPAAVHPGQIHSAPREPEQRSEQQGGDTEKRGQPVPSYQSRLNPASPPNPANMSQRREPSPTREKLQVDSSTQRSIQATYVDSETDEKERLKGQMMEMFSKMREFNEKDPNMLFELWRQERERHLDGKSSSAKPDAFSPSPAPQATPVANDAEKAASRPSSSSSQPKSTKTQQHQQAPPPAPKQASQKASTDKSSLSANKKLALVRGICNILQSAPENKSVALEPSEIVSILDGNPSYRALCQQLEDKGFNINRYHFARLLLAEVPEITQYAPAAAQSLNTNAQIHENVVAGGIATSPNVATAAVSNPSAINSASTRADASQIQAVKRMSTTNPTGNNVQKGGAYPKKPDSKPGDVQYESTPKQIEATQAGILNSNITPTEHQLQGADDGNQLTNSHDRLAAQNTASAVGSRSSAISTSQSHQIPQTKAALSRKRNFSELIDLTTLSDEDQNGANNTGTDKDFPEAKRQELDRNSSVQQGLLTPLADTSNPSVENQLNVAGLVNEKEEKRPAHEVKTSGQPGIAATASTSVTKLFDQFIVKEVDRYKAIRRSRYDPRTIARDVLLATGRHPDMRALNAHLEILQKSFKLGNYPDLSTFRWDLVDPGGPAPGSGFPELAQAETVHVDIDENDPNIAPAIPADSEALSSQNLLNGESDVATALRASGVGHWRPLSKSSFAAISIRGPGTATPQATPPRDAESTPRRRGRPPGRGNSNSTPRAVEQPPSSGGTSSYAELRRQAIASGQEPPRRGRPVGWRKWMQNSPGGTPSKPGSTATLAKPGPEPDYQVYSCKWRDCKAELHNLTTLRKHIEKVHAKPDEEQNYVCLWDKCPIRAGNGQHTEERASEKQPRTYSSQQRFLDHVEKRHIAQVAWEKGDGPTDGVRPSQTDSELSEAYLSDSQGRRVTPVIVAPTVFIPDSRVGPRGNVRQTPEEKALAEQRRVEQRRRDMGPGIDKGGARLANDKRRMGFVDDDNNMQLIDDDE